MQILQSVSWWKKEHLNRKFRIGFFLEKNNTSKGNFNSVIYRIFIFSWRIFSLRNSKQTQQLNKKFFFFCANVNIRIHIKPVKMLNKVSKFKNLGILSARKEKVLRQLHWISTTGQPNCVCTVSQEVSCVFIVNPDGHKNDGIKCYAREKHFPNAQIFVDISRIYQVTVTWVRAERLFEGHKKIIHHTILETALNYFDLQIIINRGHNIQLTFIIPFCFFLWNGAQFSWNTKINNH